MVRKHYKNIKSALRKTKIVDSYFVSKFHFSPYMGCQHGCKYCDGRSERYYVEGDFENDIVIRENSVSQLDIDLSKCRDKGIIFIGSGISDVYQPVEKDEKIMRGVIKTLIKHKVPLLILTKSALITRDIDLLKKLNKIAGVTVAFSLVYKDDKLRKIVEPGAASVPERIEALKLFADCNIGTGVMAMPILPKLVDNEDYLPKLFNLYENLNLDFLMLGSLTLRPGKNKDTYFSMIKEFFPSYLAEYQHIYRNNFPSGSPNYDYSKPFYKKANTMLKDKISPVIPLKLYANRFPLYDVFYIYLQHMRVLYAHTNTERLEIAYHNYKKWYLNFIDKIKKSRRMKWVELEEEFFMLIKMGYIQEIIQNDKLWNYMIKNLKKYVKEL